MRTLIRLKRQIELLQASNPDPEEAVEALAHVRDQLEAELFLIGHLLSGPVPHRDDDDEPAMPPTLGR